MNSQAVSKVLGVVFLAVGLLAFVPNPIVGPEALFVTNLHHDVVHLLTGVLMLVFGCKSEAAATLFLKIFGVVYILVAVLGFLLAGDGGHLLGIIHVNPADNWLHLVLGVVIAWLGCKD